MKHVCATPGPRRAGCSPADAVGPWTQVDPKEPPMGVVLAVLSMVLAGVGSLFFKESSIRMGATRTTFLYYLFGLFFSGVISPLVASEKDRMSRAGAGWAALAALA